MNSVFSLVLLLAFLAAGFFAARLTPVGAFRPLAKVFDAILWALLFSMGLRMGQDRGLFSSLGSIGLLSLAVAVVTVAGTVGAHLLLAPVYRALSGASLARRAGRAERPGIIERIRHPLFLLALVLAGAAAGFVLPGFAVVSDGTLSGWILYALLFIIGIQMEPLGVRVFRSLASPVTALVPLVTVLGTLLGSLTLVFFEDVTPGTALALGSGFGWYSLSGILIADLGNPALGAAAFLANLLRELFAFFLIPLLANTGRPEAGIGVGGATSMDVTLPLLEESWGPSVVPLCLAHGCLLSLAVPFLVPLFMGL